MNDDLADLQNLGKKSAEMLTRAGVADGKRLRELGAVAAFAQVRQSQPSVSLNLLWALEGALTGRDWKEVARHDRLSLLTALEDLERQR